MADDFAATLDANDLWQSLFGETAALYPTRMEWLPWIPQSRINRDPRGPADDPLWLLTWAEFVSLPDDAILYRLDNLNEWIRKRDIPTYKAMVRGSRYLDCGIKEAQLPTLTTLKDGEL